MSFLIRTLLATVRTDDEMTVNTISRSLRKLELQSIIEADMLYLTSFNSNLPNNFYA